MSKGLNEKEAKIDFPLCVLQKTLHHQILAVGVPVLRFCLSPCAAPIIKNE